jgi:hypothetical protein
LYLLLRRGVIKFLGSMTRNLIRLRAAVVVVVRGAFADAAHHAPCWLAECENKFARFPAQQKPQESSFCPALGRTSEASIVSLKAETYRKDNSARVRDEINVA